MKTFYTTTPIYYVNGEAHLGTIYTTTAADIITRYKRMNRKKAFFLTGTDEHGEKIAQAAEKAGLHVKEYVNNMSRKFKEAFKDMNIQYDRFIRTTDADHVKTATYFYNKVLEKGDIYKGFYEGSYCVSCEEFWTEKDLNDNNCPTCGKPVKTVKEESYFFRQSKYQKKLIEYIKKNKSFIEPETRRNEILSFLEKPLLDLSITRTSFNWGIPAPNDKKHVIYVWFDALTNYLTAAGYPKKGYSKLWPADVHLMGKEITRFHCITWPAMLMSAGLKLPKKIFGHGWWTVNGEKMSKSKGNAVYAYEVCKKYGVSADAMRYFMFKQMPFGSDGDFSEKMFIERVNNELAAELGNLVMRSATMFSKFSNSKVQKGVADKKLLNNYKKLLTKYKKEMDSLDFFGALNTAFEFVHLVNKYVTDNEPWRLAKEDTKKLDSVLYNVAQSVNAVSCLIYPFMPETSSRIDGQISTEKSYNMMFRNVKAGAKIKQSKALFPKIENIKEDALIEKREAKNVTFEEFKKLVMKTGIIKKVEKLTDKLYKLDVLADKKRVIVSGIAQYYAPEELVNKKVIVLTNLEPKNIRGVSSEGMVLAAEKDGKVVLLTTDKDIGEDAVIL